MTGIIHLHSAMRYLILIFLILAIADAFRGLSSKKAYGSSSKRYALLTLIFTHVQLLLGLVLYFFGAKGMNIITHVEGFMKEAPARFFAVEHIAGMLIAIVLITMGYSKAKRKSTDEGKFKTIRTFYLIALVVIFISIPWPFMKEFGSWI